MNITEPLLSRMDIMYVRMGRLCKYMDKAPEEIEEAVLKEMIDAVIEQGIKVKGAME